MITSAFLTIFYLFLSYVLALFPSGDLNPTLFLAIAFVVSSVKFMNWLLPIDTLFTLVQLAIIYRLVLFNLYFLLKVFKWGTGRTIL